MHPQVHPRPASCSAGAAAARFLGARAALCCPPPPSPIDFCANPPPGRLPYAAPWGTASVCRREGWGSTPPLHCPDVCPLPPRPQGNRGGGGDGATFAATSAANVAGRCRCTACGPCRPPTNAMPNGGALPEDESLVPKRPSRQPPRPSLNLTLGQGRAECWEGRGLGYPDPPPPN